MSDKPEGSLDRRQFVAVTIGGLGCLALGGVKEALARAEQSGLPVLTDKELNKLIAKAKGNPKLYQEQAKMAQGDLYAFMSKNFTLTDVQDSAIKNMSAENRATVNKAIEASTKLMTEMSASDEPVSRDWSPMMVSFSGKATTKATAKVTYEHTESENPGGGSFSSDKVAVEVSY